MLTKKEAAINSLKEKIHVMACPICSQSLIVEDRGSIICPLNHSFDISKKGYINVLKQAPKENYEKQLFESRQKVIEAGMYEPLINKINQILLSEFKGEKEKTLLDAGCGEGSHLNLLKQIASEEWLFFGLDIAKAGVSLATDHRSDITWLVGDLAKLPIQNEGLDVILNILSPGHYETFQRVLKPEGLVIKVIPQADYLKEIRENLYPDQVYSNELVKNHFEENFEVVREEKVCYSFEITETLKPKLLEMTPLTWQSSEATLKALDIQSITVSLLILIGKTKN